MSSGARTERELRKSFIEWSNAGIRIPSSGSSTQLELPDVLGSVGGVLYACEVKYSSDDYARFTVQEVIDLLHFSYFWDAVPVLVCRYSHDTTLYGEVIMTEEEIPVNGDAASFSFKREERDQLNEMERLVKIPHQQTTRDLYGDPPKDE